jgi:choline-sulfatase
MNASGEDCQMLNEPAAPFTPQNLLIILSDEHAPRALGCAGHPFVQTPNLDRLAATGTRFTAAYTPSPICVPARGAFATGQPVHVSKCWDNAIAYDGTMPSWHHTLRDRGHHVTSIGKLHFQGHAGQDYGFTEMIMPMQITNGTGDVTLLIRDPEDVREQAAKKLLAQSGPGESDYTQYDRRVTAAAQAWLRDTATKPHDKPWVLFVSMVAPHFPLTAPTEHFARYADAKLPRPKLWDAPESERLSHLAIRNYARRSDHYRHFKSEADLQRALAGYYGLVSFMDENVGKILKALEEAGLSDDTRVIYTSDHGDNLGTRGLWGKCTMYEEAVGVPMILAGDGVPAGRVSAIPVCLTDIGATALQAVGCAEAPPPHATSLFQIALGAAPDRVALSAYHASGSREAAFMLRDGPYKYVRYASYPPQLFDLAADPEELVDLATDPANALLIARMEISLRQRLGGDPADIDAAVKARQAGILAENGGREAVLARGDLPFSPPPGVTPAWS